MCDPNWEFYPRFIHSLSPEDRLKLNTFVDDVYVDGWTDGNAHTNSLTPTEHSERIVADLEVSWCRMMQEHIVPDLGPVPENLVPPADFGTQKSPSSVAKVNAEAKQTRKMMEE